MQCVLIVLTSYACPFAPCEACVQLPSHAFLACQAPFIPTLFSHKYLLLFLSTTDVFVGFSKIELSKAQRSLLRTIRRHSSSVVFTMAQCAQVLFPLHKVSWQCHWRGSSSKGCAQVSFKPRVRTCL